MRCQSCSCGYIPTAARGSRDRLRECWLSGSERNKRPMVPSVAKNNGVARGVPSGSTVASVNPLVSFSIAETCVRSVTALSSWHPPAVLDNETDRTTVNDETGAIHGALGISRCDLTSQCAPVTTTMISILLRLQPREGGGPPVLAENPIRPITNLDRTCNI